MSRALKLDHLTPDETDELDALVSAPQTFREFVDAARPGFEWYTAQRIIADKLEQVARGQIRRLMVFLPPQEGKSELVTRLFPAYFLHEHPDRWVGVGSYSFTLAKGFSRAARTYYREVVSDLSDEASAVEMWQTVRRGGLWAVGRGGSATGRPAHLLVVDDPLKDRAEADSDTIRQTLHEWYGGVLNMRLQPQNAVVVVHTRWHEDDLAGRLLAIERKTQRPERWTIIDFPGVAEPAEMRPQYPRSCVVVPDWRKPGEPLGGRYAMDRYLQVQEISGTREYESQVQQRPAPAQGTIFKRQWWRYYDADRQPAVERTAISVDCAFKDTDGSDYVAAHVYGRRGPDVYLLDRVHERLSFSDTVETLKMLAGRWRKATIYIEDKANGSAVIDTLSKSLTGIVPVEPEGGKLARAYACQGDVEHGRVFLPGKQIAPDVWEPVPWVTDFIAEAASFPSAPHDDDVDAFTQMMAEFRSELRHALVHEPKITVSSEVRADPVDVKRGRVVVPEPVAVQIRNAQLQRQGFTTKTRAPRARKAERWEGN